MGERRGSLVLPLPPHQTPAKQKTVMQVTSQLGKRETAAEGTGRRNGCSTARRRRATDDEIPMTTGLGFNQPMAFDFETRGSADSGTGRHSVSAGLDDPTKESLNIYYCYVVVIIAFIIAF